MSVINTTLLTQLSGLQKKLEELEIMIVTSVDDIENGMGRRDSQRKDIFIQEAKRILSSKLSQSKKLSWDPAHHQEILSNGSLGTSWTFR